MSSKPNPFGLCLTLDFGSFWLCSLPLLSVFVAFVVCDGVVWFCCSVNDLSETRLSSDCYDCCRVPQSALPEPLLQWEHESGSDSDIERPDPDLVLDDLASRRFHSPSPAPPTNFAVPISPLAGGTPAGGRSSTWPKVTMPPNVVPQQNVTCYRSENMKLPCDFDVPAWSNSSASLTSVCMVNCNHEQCLVVVVCCF